MVEVLLQASEQGTVLEGRFLDGGIRVRSINGDQRRVLVPTSPVLLEGHGIDRLSLVEVIASRPRDVEEGTAHPVLEGGVPVDQLP